MRAPPGRSRTSSRAGSRAVRRGPGGRCTVHDHPGELAREVLAGEEAYVVGGAVRDELLGRPLVDLDVAVRDAPAAARAFARRAGGSPFSLSERAGAWRVAL